MRLSSSLAGLAAGFVPCLVACLIACDSSSTTPGPTGTPPGADAGARAGGNASPAEVEGCKEACNKLKFFNCNDAVDHATCFANCDASDSAALEVFTACVESDICDAECSGALAREVEDVVDPPPPPSGTRCVDDCGAFLGEGCLPGASVADCASVCDSDAALASYCLVRRSGCTLPTECTEQLMPADPASVCREGCDTLGFFGCIAPTDTSECSALCGSTAAETVERFNACAGAGLCEDDSCYRILNPAGGSADVAGCRSACDNLQFFDCIDASTLSACRSRCGEVSADAAGSFIACAQGVCDGDECWQVLRDAE